jgi:histidyl-tRNA synthetase
LEGIYQALEVQDSAEILRTIDKVDKIGEQGVFNYLTKNVGVSAQVAETCLRAARIKAGSAAELKAAFHDLGLSNATISAGLDELGAVLDTVRRENRDSLIADVSIARGLDYYTGTVFEARFPELPLYPSILGGGRYDNLAGEGSAKKLPGVGGSIGLSRILGVLLNEGVLKASRQTGTSILIGMISSELYANSVEIAQILRRRNIACEIYLAPEKYGKQIRYASRKGIPYIWFPSEQGGSLGEVKDLRSGMQVPADASQWLPDDSPDIKISLDENVWQETIQKPVYSGKK